MPETLKDYKNRKKIEAFALKYDLKIPERQKASLIGELSGKGTGSSIEYQDRRDYVAGDDVRYIDWRAFARNDRLTIKLYREEICPNINILVDTSLSMSVTDEKAMRRIDLAYLFYLLAKKLQAVTGVFNLSNRMRRISTPLELISKKDIRQDSPVPLLERSPILRKGGILILISDLLYPLSPAEFINIFSASDRLILVQLLSEFESNPSQEGIVRLQDAENGEYLDVGLDKVTIEGYNTRLNRLKSDLERFTRIKQGAFVSIHDKMTLEETMKKLFKASVIDVK
jgi:uncharacterized protein (DUF58 family)